jgi:hypothetical protein
VSADSALADDWQPTFAHFRGTCRALSTGAVDDASSGRIDLAQITASSHRSSHE